MLRQRRAARQKRQCLLLGFLDGAGTLDLAPAGLFLVGDARIGDDAILTPEIVERYVEAWEQNDVEHPIKGDRGRGSSGSPRS